MSHPERVQPRFFAYDEANRTLPLVRRIVEDIMEEHDRLHPLLSRFNAMPRGGLDSGEAVALQDELKERSARTDELVGELHQLGCLFKGFQDGLVDWYSRYAGRPVFLCWKLGEPEIGWWHQIDAGFIGRQPILPSQRHAFKGDG